MLLALTLVCCGQYQSKEHMPSEILVPKISFIELKDKPNNLELIFADSSMYFNHVLAGQVAQLFIRSNEINLDNSTDTLTLLFRTPLREVKEATIQVPMDYAIQMGDRFRNAQFNQIIQDLFQMNWQTKEYFEQNETSLLDRINSYFAIWIHENYPDTPSHDYYFGFDCFDVFYQYSIQTNNEFNADAFKMVEGLLQDSTQIPASMSKDLSEIITKSVSNN